MRSNSPVLLFVTLTENFHSRAISITKDISLKRKELFYSVLDMIQGT